MPPADPEKLCKKDASQRLNNEVTYHPRAKMTEGQPATVVVLLGSGRFPLHALPGSTPTTVIPITTTCEVEAELTSTAFDIAPSGWQTSSFDDPTINDRAPLRWSWQVTPTTSGDASLDLKIQSIFSPQPGFVQEGAIRDFSATIVVTSVGASSVESIWSFINTPLVILGLSLLVGSGGIAELVRRFKKNKKKEVEQEVEEVEAIEQDEKAKSVGPGASAGPAAPATP